MFKDRLIWLIAIIVFGGIISQCSSADRDDSGKINKTGDLKVTEMRIGDCFTDLPILTEDNVTEVATVKAIPCTEPHSWEVFHKASVTLENYSEAALTAESNKICQYAIDSLISTLSALKLNEYRTADVNIFQPVASSWAKGERATKCLIGSDSEIYYTSIFD